MGGRMNLVGIFIDIITRHAIRGGTFAIVKEFTNAVMSSSTAGTIGANPSQAYPRGTSERPRQLLPRASRVRPA
jgi:hypothetical protein